MTVLRSSTSKLVHKTPAPVRRSSTQRYRGFPDLSECWEQSREHKKYFLKYLDCPEKAKYHRTSAGCLAFDSLVERWATSPFRVTFFNYYKIEGRKPRSLDYLKGIVLSSSVVSSFARCTLRKLLPSEIDGDVPAPYADWPVAFSVLDLFVDDVQEMKLAVEKCIARRLLFRNACVKACCTKLDTESHDTFLFMLNIIRAQIVLYDV